MSHLSSQASNLQQFGSFDTVPLVWLCAPGKMPGAQAGAVAQLGERQNRTLEVAGSSPAGSTKKSRTYNHAPAAGFFGLNVGRNLRVRLIRLPRRQDFPFSPSRPAVAFLTLWGLAPA